MANPVRWATLPVLGLLICGVTACLPGNSGDADDDAGPGAVLHAWTAGEEGGPEVPYADLPEILTSEDEIDGWLDEHVARGSVVDQELVSETLAPALEENYLVAARGQECAGINGMYLDELAGGHVLRVDYAEPAEEDQCGETGHPTEIWQMPQDQTEEQLPAAVVTSSAAGDQMPETVRTGSSVWSREIHSNSNELWDLLDETSLRLYSTTEDLGELSEMLSGLLEDEQAVEPLEEVDFSASSLVVVGYDRCGGAWVEIEAAPQSDPVELDVNVMAPDVLCEAPAPAVAVWEVPDVILGDEATVEKHHVMVDV